MSRVFWDTMLFVYLVEDNPQYATRVAQILTRMNERGDELYTSALALGEVLTGPYKKGATEGIARARQVFADPSITVLPFTADAAVTYAEIRSRHRVSPADAVHLACASQARTDLFLTNDASLVGKMVPGIQFIAGLNTDLF